MTKKVAVRGVLKLLDTLVEPTQENAPRLVRRGRMRASIGDFRDAIADLSLAIDLDSTLGEAYLNRAIVRLRLNQFDEALRDIECDLKLRPDESETHRVHGDVLRSLGRKSDAIDSYDLALGLDPHSYLARLSRGYVHLELGEWESAISDLQAVIDLGHRDDEVTTYLQVARERLASE